MFGGGEYRNIVLQDPGGEMSLCVPTCPCEYPAQVGTGRVERPPKS